MLATDFHAHIPTQRGHMGGGFYKAAPFVRAMDSNEVGRSVVLPLDGLFDNAFDHNIAMADWISGHDDRLIPFAAIDPYSSSPAEQLRHAVEELGFRGLKIHPWLQGVNPLAPQLGKVYRMASNLQVPILFHDGTPPDSTPLQVAVALERYPECTIILGHGGLYDLWPEAIAAALRYPQLLLCMTSLHPMGLREVIDQVPIHQLLFGSDAGVSSDPDALYVQARWSEFRRIIAPETVRIITEINPARVLGL